jgi:lipopolysaccharide transport system ATP-binding protein
MSSAAITVEELSKAYRIGRKAEAHDTLVGALTGALSAPWKNWRRLSRLNTFAEPNGHDAEDIIWAVRDVSFEVQEGEVLGIIGRNGAGKSTLLKILSRITEPTSGRAVIHGRVSSLLEVGTGFHHELTGRDNVYMNGTILGMTKREIDRKFDEIVEFSGVEKFLDTPIKHYSSGMKVRLAFAVAANLEPEILIIDEVLAVGDAEFQKKCLGKMKDVAGGGRTVLFVSHNMTAVCHLCSRCIVFDKGRQVIDSSPEASIGKYSLLCGTHTSTRRDLCDHAGRTPGSIPTMQRLSISAGSDRNGTPVRMGDDMAITVQFSAPKQLDDVTFGFVIKNHLQVPVFGNNTLVTHCAPLDRPIRTGSITAQLNSIPLMPGEYSVDLYFGAQGHNFDVVIDATAFTVEASNVFRTGRLPPTTSGSIFWPVTWKVNHEQPSTYHKYNDVSATHH